MAVYRLFSQAEGRSAFAEVEVTAASAEHANWDVGGEVEWVAAATDGVAWACQHFGVGVDGVVVRRVVGTYVDTSPEVVRVAAIMAVAWLMGDDSLEPAYEDGAWVVRARSCT